MSTQSSRNGGGRAKGKQSGNLPSLPDENSNPRKLDLALIQYLKQQESEAKILSNQHNQNLMTQVYGRYGIKRGDDGAAKLVASKVAINAFPVPTMEMLEVLKPSQSDLANALEYTTGFAVDQCEKLLERPNENRSAKQYVRIRKPIYTDSEKNKSCPASTLRYLIWLSMLAAEEVHEWTNIGSSPLVDRKKAFQWLPKG